MYLFELYIGLLGIIACVGVIGRKMAMPTPLLLVIGGMALSFFPGFPELHLRPDLVLYIFLPLLIYQTSTVTSVRDIKQNMRPIMLLSIGHVIFITVLVAMTAHAIIPELSWPMAFVLGAVISPPDDVAIVAVAEKIHIPQRLLTILLGEGLLNDATALILFRFSLAAVITHQFSAVQAVASFFAIIIGETLYGIALGYLLGELRLKLKDPKLEMMLSLLTPFLAYIPPVQFGGSGVLATVVTGLVIGNRYYSERFSPEIRLLAVSIWETISFTLQSILFLLVGLNLRAILDRISSISITQLILYGTAITIVVIVGRFIWVYPAAYLPRYLSKSIRKKDPYPPWQYPFIVSWAGMRGGISLAAAFAVPSIPAKIGNVDLRDLLIFLVFCIITATLLIQGLTLPWLLETLGVNKIGRREKQDEHLAELTARIEIAKAVIAWLFSYKESVQDTDPDSLEEVKLQIREYQILKKRLEAMIKNYKDGDAYKESAQQKCALFIFKKIIQVETGTLTQLWREGKITHRVRSKLLQQLDLRSKHLSFEEKKL